MQNRNLGNLILRSSTLLNSHDAMQKCFRGSHVTSIGKQRKNSATWKPRVQSPDIINGRNQVFPENHSSQTATPTEDQICHALEVM